MLPGDRHAGKPRAELDASEIPDGEHLAVLRAARLVALRGMGNGRPGLLRRIERALTS